jgi:hypothetical protein
VPNHLKTRLARRDSKKRRIDLLKHGLHVPLSEIPKASGTVALWRDY